MAQNGTELDVTTTSSSSSGGPTGGPPRDHYGGVRTAAASAGPAPGPAAIGAGHRPALNDWKFPATPRVSTPVPADLHMSGQFEGQPHQLHQHIAAPSSPAPLQPHQFQQQQQQQQQQHQHQQQQQQQQQPLDYFNHPVSSYAMQAQQQRFQQQQQQQSSFMSHGDQHRDGTNTPRSPYSVIGSVDGGVATDPFSGPLHDSSSIHNLQSAAQQSQSVQGSTHSHSQSQESVDRQGLLQHLPTYQYQLQHDIAQPGHTPIPPAPSMAPPQPLSSPLPHQLQTPSEFALKMLFTQFVKMAEAKLNAMVHLPLVRNDRGKEVQAAVGS